METWILIAAGAYFLTAITFVIDKYLLALPIPKPLTYAFWVAMLSASVVFLIPFFEILIPGATYLLISLASGSAFFMGLIFLYKTMLRSDVSVASTQVGVLTSIFTYIFSYLILSEILPLHNTAALALLVVGILLLGRVGKKIMLQAIMAGAFIALSFVTLKWTFTQGDFVNGLFWTRIGFVGAAAASLISSKARKEIRAVTQKVSIKSKGVFVFNKILAGVAFILLYYAISQGNVTIINALLGLQFLFVFLIALTLRNKLPMLEERLERKDIIVKFTGILLILAGFLAILL